MPQHSAEATIFVGLRRFGGSNEHHHQQQQQHIVRMYCVLAAAAALAPGLKAPGRTPQVLRLRDATTGQEISLVGTVHYNPASVARAKDEVSSAIDRSPLGAVVVESCTNRWGRSLELAPPGSLPARLICSEMQGAAGIAMQNQVPVMLGDVIRTSAHCIARVGLRLLNNPNPLTLTLTLTLRRHQDDTRTTLVLAAWCVDHLQRHRHSLRPSNDAICVVVSRGWPRRSSAP